MNPGFAVVHGVGRVPEFLADGERVEVHVVELHVRQRRHGVGGVGVGLLRREERADARALDGHLERRGRRGGGGHGQNAGGLVVARGLGKAVRLLGVVHVAVVGGHVDVVERDGRRGLLGRDADEMVVSNASTSTACTFSGTVTEPLRLSTDTSTEAVFPSVERGRLEELHLQSLRLDVVVAVERLRDVDEARSRASYSTPSTLMPRLFMMAAWKSTARAEVPFCADESANAT